MNIDMNKLIENNQWLVKIDELQATNEHLIVENLSLRQDMEKFNVFIDGLRVKFDTTKTAKDQYEHEFYMNSLNNHIRNFLDGRKNARQRRSF